MSFGISGGNEDYRTWNTFNRMFARPIHQCHLWKMVIIFQVKFISDRDKGLDKSLSEILHHIKENVKTWFGLIAAEMVLSIATTF